MQMEEVSDHLREAATAADRWTSLTVEKVGLSTMLTKSFMHHLACPRESRHPSAPDLGLGVNLHARQGIACRKQEFNANDHPGLFACYLAYSLDSLHPS